MRKKLVGGLLAGALAVALAFSWVVGFQFPAYARQVGESREQEEVKKTSDFQASGRIWIAGDSIAADHSYEDEASYARFVHGWGEMLGNYLTEDAQVFNKAISGQTAKFFIEETNYQDIMDGLGKGDILLVQFGHNDYKSAGSDHSTLPTDVEGSYKWYLKHYYIDPALDVGAMPVLCTSVVLCQWNEGFVSENQAQAKFANAMRELYAEYQAQGIEIGLIDTYALTETLLNADSAQAGGYYAVKYKRASYDGGDSVSLDHVHFSEKGADATAKIIAQNLFLMYRDLNRFNVKGLVDGGKGTSEEPYLISDWAQLYQILQDDERNTPQIYYKLTEDLMPAIQRQQWKTVFRANLDGGGHSVKNPIGRSLGAFFDENDGVISNLCLDYHLDYTVDDMQAPFVWDNYGTIRNCSSAGTIDLSYYSQEESGLWDVGMFAAVNHEKAVIDNCKNEAKITVNADVTQVYLGGIAGRNGGIISNCANSSNLCIDTSDYNSYHATVRLEVVCCGGGIAGIATDTSEISGCSSDVVPRCYTAFESAASAVLAEQIVPITEQALRQLLDEQLSVKGDLDGDGKVNLEDAQLALRIALGIVEPTDGQRLAADFNEDGNVSLDEVRTVLTMALQIA